MRTSSVALLALLWLTSAFADSSFVAPTPSVVASKITQVVASGTTVRSSGVKFAQIGCLGGGGAGGGSASTTGQNSAGGGGGAGSLSWVNVNAPAGDYVITIGAAGTAGTTGNNPGGNGGDTSVVVNGVTVCVGKGGTGGGGAASAFAGTAGAGGVAGTGDVTSTGHGGGPGIVSSGLNTNYATTGAGGNSLWGAGGISVTILSTATGAAASGNGAGGAGGTAVGTSGTAQGGVGTIGKVVIYEYNSQ